MTTPFMRITKPFMHIRRALVNQFIRFADAAEGGPYGLVDLTETDASTVLTYQVQTAAGGWHDFDTTKIMRQVRVTIELIEEDDPNAPPTYVVPNPVAPYPPPPAS